MTESRRRTNASVLALFIATPIAWTVAGMFWFGIGLPSPRVPWQPTALDRRVTAHAAIAGAVRDRHGVTLSEPALDTGGTAGHNHVGMMIAVRPHGSPVGIVGAGTHLILPIGVQGQLLASNQRSSLTFTRPFLAKVLGSPALAPPNIADVDTTLDAELSKAIDHILRAHAGVASAVVIEVPDGRLRAVVDVPGPNVTSDQLADSERGLRSLLPVNLPASTAKVFTGGFLLASGGHTSAAFACDGRHCWMRHGLVRGLEEAMLKSCNVWFINQARRIHFADWRAFLLSLGIAPVAQPGLPGSAIVLPTPPQTELPWPLAVGQQLYVSMVGLAAAYGTATDPEGRLVVPRIIDRVGGETIPMAPRPQVVEPTVTQTLRQILRANGVRGTGAVVNRMYRDRDAGGKTGTAQVDGRPSDAVFVAVAPWAQPRWIVAVTLREGRRGQTAGAVAGQILNEITRAQPVVYD